MRNRSRTDIIGMMLQAAQVNGGATKTRMMYSAYLSYAQVQEYTRYLMDRGLLSLEKETQLYRLTSKGQEFLHLNDRMKELISSSSDKALQKPRAEATE